MVGEVEQQNYGDRFFADVNTRLRDLEEKQRLLKDRMLLISEGFVKERDKGFSEMQEIKKVVEKLKMDNERVKEILLRVGESINGAARKEDLMILERQFGLFRNPEDSLTQNSGLNRGENNGSR